jgi:hypothetical protein
MTTIIRNNDIDEGVIAFSMWLGSQGKDSSSTVSISAREFVLGRLVILHDHAMQKDIPVEISNGVPFCKECDMNDCAHVGFAICTEQMHRHPVLE